MTLTAGDGVSDADSIPGWAGDQVQTRNYSTAYIEVTVFNTAITVNGGITGQTALQVLNVTTGATAATIGAVGLYAVPAIGNLSLTGNTGSTVNLMLKR